MINLFTLSDFEDVPERFFVFEFGVRHRTLVFTYVKDIIEHSQFYFDNYKLEESERVNKKSSLQRCYR